MTLAEAFAMAALLALDCAVWIHNIFTILEIAR